MVVSSMRSLEVIHAAGLATTGHNRRGEAVDSRWPKAVIFDLGGVIASSSTPIMSSEFANVFIPVYISKNCDNVDVDLTRIVPTFHHVISKGYA